MTMRAYVYALEKSAMQSGLAQTGVWVVTYDHDVDHRACDPVMGWPSTHDTNAQVRLTFHTKDEALAYCATHNLAVEVVAHAPVHKYKAPKSYSDNFTKGYRN